MHCPILSCLSVDFVKLDIKILRLSGIHGLVISSVVGYDDESYCFSRISALIKFAAASMILLFSSFMSSFLSEFLIYNEARHIKKIY